MAEEMPFNGKLFQSISSKIKCHIFSEKEERIHE